jgi:hypothetical protein
VKKVIAEKGESPVWRADARPTFRLLHRNVHRKMMRRKMEQSTDLPAKWA